MELIATTLGAGVTALVVGSIAGGLAAGVSAAVLTFIISLAAIFVVHFLRAPSKLDSERQTEIDKLNAAVKDLRDSAGELEAKHQSELKALKKREKEIRFKLYRRYRKILTDVKELLEPQVSIDYIADQPSFIALKTGGRKHYRVIRVRVTNTGGAPLYNLRAQLKLTTRHTSYDNEDLTLKEEGLPIIRQILYRHEQHVLPRPQTSFNLSRGESQFVDVAMQENEDGKWGTVTLCLSRIGVDNYSNIVNPSEPVEFSIVVLGDMSPCSRNFVLSLDDVGVLQMKAAD
ncbi:MAG TPA: hypothetical protein VGB76_00105 [Pyrinomonadaceae bacterium]